MFVDDIAITGGVVEYVGEDPKPYFALATPSRRYKLYPSSSKIEDAYDWVRALNRVSPQVKVDAATEARLAKNVREGSGGVGDGIPSSSDEDD